MIKNILVTGAAGRLGNYVCPYLKELGYNVSGTDIIAPARDSANMKARIPFIKANLLDCGELVKAVAFAQADMIIHLGAITGSTELQRPYEERDLGPTPSGRNSVWRQEEDNCMKINTMGTYYVLDAARRMDVKYVIGCSSYYAYGQAGQIGGRPITINSLPITEDHPLEPGDTYSMSKYFGEEMMKAFCRSYDMRCIAMRLMGVFYHDMPFAKFVYKFPVPCPDKASNAGGYLDGGFEEHVDSRDIARFIGLAIPKMDELPNAFEAFHVWSCTHFDCDTAKAYAVKYPAYGDMVNGIKGQDGLFSIEKARKLLGYEPMYDWKKGTVDYTNDDYKKE